MGNVCELNEIQILSINDLNEINGGSVASALGWMALGALVDYACEVIFDKSLGEVIVDCISAAWHGTETANEIYFKTFHSD